MRRDRLRTLLTTAIALITLSACGAGSSSAAAQVATGPGTGEARPDSSRYPYTAADVHFMTSMIAHHAQALVMAGWAPSHGASPAVQTLAGRILNGQRDEIASIQQWLRDRGQQVPTVMADGMVMMGSEHVHHGAGGMEMPGMLSQQQLDRLSAARGTLFDQLFLTYMIQHHRGAVSMVRELFASPGAGQDETVFRFASDVNVDQATEIERMQGMLAEAISQ